MLLHMCIVKDLPDMSEEATSEKSCESTDKEKNYQSTSNTNHCAIQNV